MPDILNNKTERQGLREVQGAEEEVKLEQESNIPDITTPILDTAPTEVPKDKVLGIEKHEGISKQEPTEITIDKRTEIGSILQNDLHDTLDKLPHGQKQDIRDSGRELRDRLYDGMNDHLFDDNKLVEIINEWLSKFDMGGAYTLTESRNRAVQILELFSK